MDAFFDAVMVYMDAHSEELLPEAHSLFETLEPPLRVWVAHRGPEGATDDLPKYELISAAAIGLAAGWIELTQLRPPTGSMDARAQAALAYAGMGGGSLLNGFMLFCGHHVGRNGPGAVSQLKALLDQDVATLT